LENFIGWPILRELGGYALQQYGSDIYKRENRISYKDWHPNSKGHRIIADEIYNKYKKLYT
jgi:lysophospholipase L1-like esterase